MEGENADRFRLSNRCLGFAEFNSKMTTRTKICLFGLSADPPTGYGGHVGIVQALKQMEEWDEIWVLPVYRHTFAVRLFCEQYPIVLVMLVCGTGSIFRLLTFFLSVSRDRRNDSDRFPLNID